MDKNHIPIIFGLKIRQFRNKLGLSAEEVANLANISKSYLNEIEKGKKYPKADKIMALSSALQVPYNELVSLDLEKKLQPISALLESNILSEIPLQLFGIDERTLIDVMVDAPEKITSFISTLIELCNHYNFTKESFYLAALRSYQEVHDNYFEWIEVKSREFAQGFQIVIKPEQKILEAILIENYGYELKYIEFEEENPLLKNLRSIFIEKSKTLLINKGTTTEQALFILAKEIGVNFLELKDRVNTFSWAQFKTFEEVLNNFYASYFAGALLIPEQDLVPKLQDFYRDKIWNPEEFNDNIRYYGQSAETFYHRLSNLLPKHLNLKSLFFLRLVHPKNSEKFVLDKELHLEEKQSPHAIEMHEHYCRRWVSVKVLQQIENTNSEMLTDCQISIYPQYNNKRYWVVSTAVQDLFDDNKVRSVTLGFTDKALLNKMKTTDGKEIPAYEVDITCENCPIMDCQERVSEPVRLIKNQQRENLIKGVEEFSLKFKN